MFLAQANIAYFRWSLEDVRMAEFVQQIAPVNEIAEKTDGFVWRFTESYSPRDIGPPWNHPLLFFNMSVWRDMESLKKFVKSPQHDLIMRNRHKWLFPVSPRSSARAWLRLQLPFRPRL